MTRPSARELARLALAVAILVATSGGATAAVADGTQAQLRAAGADQPHPAQAAPTPTPTETNDSQVHHENPDEVDQLGNDTQIRRWLSGRMERLLTDSAVNISQGQYRTGRDLLGDRYDEYLEKYVDVAGPTGADEQRELLDETRQTQREYATLREEYDRTYSAYREARRNGNEQRARELARKLDRLAGRINATGGNLTERYQRVENGTGVSLANASASIDRSTENVTERTQTAVTDTLVRTRLSVRAAGPGSFADPVRLTGRLTTANGTAISSSVTVVVAGRDRQVTPGPNGSFALSWRPRTVPAGEPTVAFAYVPDDESVYLGANATATVEIRQVDPSVTVRTDPDAAAFDDAVTVRGRVTAADRGVDDVPVRVSIGTERVARVLTGGDGRFAVDVRLPAAVTAGERRVVASVPLEGRAIAGAGSTTTLQVRETGTNLTVDAAWRDGSVVTTGRLTTADGRPLADRSLRLELAGSSVGTVRTNETGHYRLVLPGSENATAGSTVRVRFDASATSLAAARASDVLGPRPGAKNSGLFGGQIGALLAAGATVLRNAGPVPLAAGATGLVALATGGWYWRRNGGAPATVAESTADAAAAEQADATDEADATSGTERPGTAAPLAAATAALDAGDADGAVRSAYAAVRQELREGPADASTHWEFYERAGDRLGGDERDALRTVTAAYDRATFAPDGVESVEAADALDAARTLVE